jgi:hypothetical protein
MEGSPKIDAKRFTHTHKIVLPCCSHRHTPFSANYDYYNVSLFTMKIYGSALLALVGIHSCSAFISQPAASTYSSSRLFSERMPQRVNAGEGYPRSSADVINTDLSRRASAEDYGIGGALLAEPPVSASLSQLDDTWHNSRPVKVQGGSLRTWSFESPRIEYVQVLMKTEGRPLNAEVELWQGPGMSLLLLLFFVDVVVLTYSNIMAYSNLFTC